MADMSGDGIRMIDLFVKSAISCKTKSLLDIPPSHLNYIDNQDLEIISKTAQLYALIKIKKMWYLQELIT